MLILGITGGSGAGKTTLLKEIEALGALVIDCDAVYHDLLETDAEMLSEIEARFEGVVRNDTLDRKALGEVVFCDEEALSELNMITHKYVGREVDRLMADAEKAGARIIAIDAIALIESGLSKKCDAVIGVMAPREIRAKRLVDREGVPYEYALKRIDAQKPDSFFIENCDYVLSNSSDDIGKFKGACKALLSKIISDFRRNNCEHI